MDGKGNLYWFKINLILSSPCAGHSRQITWDGDIQTGNVFEENSVENKLLERPASTLNRCTQIECHAAPFNDPLVVGGASRSILSGLMGFLMAYRCLRLYDINIALHRYNRGSHINHQYCQSYPCSPFSYFSILSCDKIG